MLAAARLVAVVRAQNQRVNVAELIGLAADVLLREVVLAVLAAAGRSERGALVRCIACVEAERRGRRQARDLLGWQARAPHVSMTWTFFVE